MKTNKCPKCGTQEGLYRSVEVRWQSISESWEPTGEGSTNVDCTVCDWLGDLAETEVET